MNADYETEILLIEDNPFDAELTIREFRRHDLGNKLVHVKDGAASCRTKSSHRTNRRRIEMPCARFPRCWRGLDFGCIS